MPPEQWLLASLLQASYVIRSERLLLELLNYNLLFRWFGGLSPDALTVECIEKVFGWIKQCGGLRQFKVRGTDNVAAVFGLQVVAYNLIRLGKLITPAKEAACTASCPQVWSSGCDQASPTRQNL